MMQIFLAIFLKCPEVRELEKIKIDNMMCRKIRDYGTCEHCTSVLCDFTLNKSTMTTIKISLH